MRLSEDFLPVSFRICKNRFNKYYISLRMFDTDILLFIDFFMGYYNNRGDICIRAKTKSKYQKIGHWNKIGEVYEMMIKGKGVFYGMQVNEITYHIHEALPNDRKEKSIIEAYRNSVDKIKDSIG